MNAQPCVWDAGVIQQHAGTKKAGAEPAFTMMSLLFP